MPVKINEKKVSGIIISSETKTLEKKIKQKIHLNLKEVKSGKKKKKNHIFRI